jgi:uncharacterized protein
MRALSFALLALLAFGAPACAPRPTQGEPALWRIADADSEIWLFGTVHVLPDNVHWRSDRVMQAFHAAEEFMTETDTNDAATPQFQALAAQHGTLPAGQALSATLGPGDTERLQSIASDLGLDFAALERERPWLVGVQISVTYAARAGHSAEAGVENRLAAEARAQRKRLTFLETPEQQIRVLADLPPAAEQRFLISSISEIEQGGGVLDAMDAAWARGDTAELGRLLDAQWRDAGPEIHDALILRRNQAWADEIARRLEGSGRIFIAVGAAHLVGEGNVVELLRQRGVEVEGP